MTRRVSLATALLGAWGLGAQLSTPLPVLTLPVGGGALAVGDLNRDGRPDIVSAQQNAVTVYLGDGRGGFQRAAGSPFAAGKNPNYSAFQDFNEDGWPA